MKKLSRKTRDRDVQRTLKLRLEDKKRGGGGGSGSDEPTSVESPGSIQAWLEIEVASGLNITIDKQRRVSVVLPRIMNFSNEFETTCRYINLIRRIAEADRVHGRYYRLALVDFDGLESISTSAALVLTAELSKWDDSIRNSLRPRVDNWNEKILNRFSELGFFNLFKNDPTAKLNIAGASDEVKLVRYIKGACGDSDKIRVLKESITDIVGDDVAKWVFLHSGLTEAITNVSHHAYPDQLGFSEADRNWYLTGVYDPASKGLKVVFYDQGIGIPKSLPASDLYERVLEFLSVLPPVDRQKDREMLRAAVELSRTSTGDEDRGKGLQDLLEFINQRGNGYLSLLSSKGLYKYTVDNGVSRIKTASFENSINGTLIIWKVDLDL